MEENDVIIDRLLLISDVLNYAPQAAGRLLAALSDGERTAFLNLLEKLTDKTEEIFTGGAGEGEAVPGMPVPPERLENGIICTDCELRCPVLWDAEKNLSGAKCACGITAAKKVLEQLAGEN